MFPMQTQLESSDRSSTVVWNRICPLEDIWPGTGAAALIDGQQIAIIRMPDGQTLYATANFDPFSKAFVMARGIVGDRNGVPKIASPIFKQNFDLRTGICLDDPGVALAVYPCRVVDGQIEVGIVP
jgi:nitrite reductase (NADH) small subunit